MFRRQPHSHKKNLARTLIVESLEKRELMAADVFDEAVLQVAEESPHFVPTLEAAVGVAPRIKPEGIGALETRNFVDEAFEAYPEFDAPICILDVRYLPMNAVDNVSTPGNFSASHDSDLDLAPGSSVRLPSLTLGAFKLTDVVVEKDGNRLKVTGTMTAPSIGAVAVTGFVSEDCTNYSLTTEPRTLTIGGFELENGVVTLTDDGLKVTGEWTHSLVGTVTFTGRVVQGEPISLEAKSASRSLLNGLVQFEGVKLTLTTQGVSIAANATVAKIGKVEFHGAVAADGGYHLGGSAGIELAGFKIDGAAITLGNEALGINFTMPIQGLGDVEFGGSYGPNGDWSITGTYPGPVTIGPVVLKDITLTIADDFIQARCKGTIANLDSLVEADATTTFFFDGRIETIIDTQALKLGNFALGRSIVTAGNNNPERKHIVTIESKVGFEGNEVNLQGFIDELGNYRLTGNQIMTLGSLEVSEAEFVFSKETGFTCRGYINALGAKVTLEGQIDADGNYSFKGTQSVKVGGFTITDAEFEHSKENGLTFRGVVDVLKTKVVLEGRISPNGDYSFKGTQSIDFAGYTINEAEFTLSKDKGLSVSGTINVLGNSLRLEGQIDSNGGYTLQGKQSVKVGGFTINDAEFVLSKDEGLTIRGTLNVLGSVELKGRVTSDGDYTLSGINSVRVAGVTLHDATFKLSKDEGLTVSGIFNVPGKSVGLKGDIKSDGSFKLTGSDSITLGGVTLSGAEFKFTDTGFEGHGQADIAGTNVNLEFYVDSKGNFKLNVDGLIGVLDRLDPSAVADLLIEFSGDQRQKFLDSMSPERITEVLNRLDNVDTLEDVLDRLSATKAGKVLDGLDKYALIDALGCMNASRIAEVLQKAEIGTIKESLKRLSDSMVADVLENFGKQKLEGALGCLNLDRLAEVLERVNGATLKESLKRLSDATVTNVLDRFDKVTLGEALKRMSTERIADVLKRAELSTIKEALKRVDSSVAKAVIDNLGKKAADAAKDFLRKADPRKYKEVDNLSKKAVDAGKKSWDDAVDKLDLPKVDTGESL